MLEHPTEIELAEKPTLAAGLIRAVSCSMLFIGVYGITNYLASLRSDVGSAHFEWERSLPLVPIMIVPYMSIDLFFFASFLLCTDRKELRVLTLRIVAAIFIAAFFFIVIPQKVVYERGVVEGFWGPAYAFLYSFDQPYNLAPSLHIAFRSILWFIYVRHTQGLLNGVLRIWFILIGVSTILTHQHHIIDLATGQMLAMFCFYLFPDPRFKIAPGRRRIYSITLARRYALGALNFIVFGLLLWPWGSLLLWPAFSLLMVAMAYYGLGPGIFRKLDGRLPLSTRLWLGPFLLGSYCTHLILRRRNDPFAQVAPGIYLGRRIGRREANELRRLGVAGVLDLTAEYDSVHRDDNTKYLNIPVLDLTPPSAEQLDEACAFLREHESSTGGVYVHCALGLSRSATVVAAHLIASGKATDADDAIAQIRKVRPNIVLSDAALAVLKQVRRSDAQ